MSRWQDAFRPPTLRRNLSPVWWVFFPTIHAVSDTCKKYDRFSLFQVVSSYTNTGMSLEDQSMIPFQRAYPTIVFMVILILAGNTAFVSDPSWFEFLLLTCATSQYCKFVCSSITYYLSKKSSFPTWLVYVLPCEFIICHSSVIVH